MFRWFRRRDEDDEDDFEEEGEDVALPDQIDFGEPTEPILESRRLPDVPEFAVIVAAAATNGWHMAAIVTDTPGPDFYLRAITVRWPFFVARPIPSTRISDRPVKSKLRSPTGSNPARKLVVNWGWSKLEESFSQLRFYVKRTPTMLLPSSTGRLKVRLTLKESGIPRRRIVVPVKSNAVTWQLPDLETPEEPPEPSI